MIFVDQLIHHVCLLSSRNLAFVKLLAQIIKLRTQFFYYTIKNIPLYNAGEFTSQTFDNYCMSIGISVEDHVTHVHTQNDVAKSFIKCLQLIARLLLMRAKLHTSVWGYAILYVVSVVPIRPIIYHKYSPLQSAYSHKPNIFHFRSFGCQYMFQLLNHNVLRWVLKGG